MVEANTRGANYHDGACARVADQVRSAALVEFYTMEQSLRSATARLAAAEAITAGHARPAAANPPAPRAASTFCTEPIFPPVAVVDSPSSGDGRSDHVRCISGARASRAFVEPGSAL
jgi:hypothetical protein